MRNGKASAGDAVFSSSPSTSATRLRQGEFDPCISHHKLALEKLVGRNKLGRDVLREFEVLAVSEQLFEGYLYDIGVSDDKVQAIVSWRDQLYRTLATASRTSIDQLALNLHEASFKGGSRFEIAITHALEVMGFRACRDGASGKKDILLFAPAGEATFRLTIEAKGKKHGALINDDAEISGADAHRADVNADHAVVVGRKFQGFELTKSEPPMVLRECLTSGRVSIMEVDAMVALLHAMNRYHYPLDMVKEVFTAIESPAEKLERIRKLDQPFEAFDYAQLLNRIDFQQGDRGRGRAVSYLTIWQDWYQDDLELEDFERKLSALHIIAYPLIIFDASRQQVALRQSPAMILERVHSMLEANDRPALD